MNIEIKRVKIFVTILLENIEGVRDVVWNEEEKLDVVCCIENIKKIIIKLREVHSCEDIVEFLK